VDVIDKVTTHTTTKGNKIVRVRILSNIFPIVRDKFASIMLRQQSWHGMVGCLCCLMVDCIEALFTYRANLGYRICVICVSLSSRVFQK
jgi:hypothetical protein